MNYNACYNCDSQKVTITIYGYCRISTNKQNIFTFTVVIGAAVNFVLNLLLIQRELLQLLQQQRQQRQLLQLPSASAPDILRSRRRSCRR